MQRLKKAFTCAIILAMMILPSCAIWNTLGLAPFGAANAATYYESLEVGDTAYLYTKATGKALTGASWTCSDPYNVQILSQDMVSCRIRVNGYTSSRVIVQCQYWYQELIGNYFYTFSGYTDYYIDIRPNEVVISLNPNGGSVSSSSITRHVGETYGTLPTPTRSGYSFDGWYTSGGSRITAGTSLVSDSAHTLYAEWTPTNYSIFFDGNGADSGSMSSMSCSYGSSYTLRTNQFTRSGYTFSGWSTSSDGSGTHYANGASVKNLVGTGGGSIRLYAIWSTNSTRLSDYSISLSQTSYEYNRSHRRPSVTIKSGLKVLTQDKDYIVSYRDNIYPGTATAVIRGIGAYSGTIEKTFTINKASVSASLFASRLVVGETTYISISSTRGAVYTGYDSDVVYVSADGKVTAMGVGTTTIKVTAYEDAYHKASSCTLSVTVTQVTGGKCGDKLTWSVDSTGKTLTISGTGDMYDFSSEYKQPWHSFADTVTSIVVENGVRSTGTYSFSWFESLRSVTLADSVLEIGDYSFWYCDSLSSISFSSNLESMGTWAFCACEALSSITIGDSVKSIGDECFYGCDNLTNVTLGSGLEYIGNDAFKDTYRTKNKAYYSGNCLVFGSWLVDLWSVEERTVIPKQVAHIADSTLPYWPYSTDVSLASGNNNFVWSYSGDSLCLYTADKTKLVWSKRTSNIKNLVLPDGLKQIESYAFFQFTSLETVYIPDSVESIGERAFAYCANLKSITIPGSVKNIGSEAFFVCNSLESIVISDGVTEIKDSTFSSCDKLVSVKLPGSLEIIGNGAFSNCDALKEITIPAGVHTIGNSAFSGCTALKEIAIPAGVHTIGNYAFSGCTAFSRVSLPAGLKTVGVNPFDGCTSLTTIGISSANPTFKISSGALINKATGTLICYPSGLTQESFTVPNGVHTIGPYAFAEHTSLRKLTLPAGVQTIDNRAFYVCTSLQEISLPESVSHINQYAFYKCSSLASVRYSGSESMKSKIIISSYNDALTNAEWICSKTDASIETPSFTFTIPSGVTVIEMEAFAGITVETVVIPDGCIVIGNRAFADCPNLKYARIPSSVVHIAKDAFGSDVQIILT